MSDRSLNATFFALADPTRRKILARLARGEVSVKELLRPSRLSAPAITKHLKVLERTGLISRSRRAQWRPCRLRAAPLQEVSDWVETYRRNWEESFDRLDIHLRELQKTSQAPRQKNTSRKNPPKPQK